MEAVVVRLAARQPKKIHRIRPAVGPLHQRAGSPIEIALLVGRRRRLHNLDPRTAPEELEH